MYLWELWLTPKYTRTHKECPMMHQFEEINAAPMMTLNNRATSGDALKCARDIASSLQLHEQRARKRKVKDQRMYELAIELIIGDLFCNYIKPATGWVYRSLSRDNFSDEIVGYKTFKQVILQFQQAGLIEVWRGGNVKNTFYEQNHRIPEKT